MTTIKPLDYWNKKHLSYQSNDIFSSANYFAKKAISYFPPKSKVLDLGCGKGNDSEFFASQGHLVTATDFSPVVIDYAKTKYSHFPVTYLVQDLTLPFPFPDNSFEVIFASQSLHFFDLPTTKRIFSEIHRVLGPGGILAILVNSTSDPEISQFTMVEPDFYQTPNGIRKRYFSVDTLKPYVNNYQPLVFDESGTSHINKNKGILNQTEFIGKKL